MLVAGASGLIGSALCAALRARGDEAVGLPRFGTAPWSAEGADAVVNLAGASVAGKRWSPAYKREILDSRVLTTRALVDAIAGAQRKPRVLVNASAVGYYGGRGDEVLDESAPPGRDFLAGLCVEWEAEAARAPGRSVF
ncbi:MAG TPA: NAD-dependent epimerase/dehydratase family protein, partial [Myxococcales bacterium]